MNQTISRILPVKKKYIHINNENYLAFHKIIHVWFVAIKRQSVDVVRSREYSIKLKKQGDGHLFVPPLPIFLFLSSNSVTPPILAYFLDLFTIFCVPFFSRPMMFILRMYRPYRRLLVPSVSSASTVPRSRTDVARRESNLTKMDFVRNFEFLVGIVFASALFVTCLGCQVCHCIIKVIPRNVIRLK